MTNYSFRPGRMDAAVTDNNGLSRVTALLDSEKPTLLVTMHPECRCSVATVSEMQRISDECGGQLRMVAIFADYETLPVAAEKCGLWKKAARVTGVQPILDSDGSLRSELKAATSGESFLFSPSGEIIYHGGITSARGHEGASSGGDAVITYYRKHLPSLATAPVFGCNLDDR